MENDQTDPTSTDATTPGQADPTTGAGAPGGQPTAEEQLASERLERAKAEARAEAYKEIAATRPQADPTGTASPQEQPLPNNAWETYSAEERAALESEFISNPSLAAAKLADRSAKLERLRIERQAAPMVSAQAATFVELFKNRMIAENPQLGKQIAELFDADLRGIDLRPLVAMTPETREKELSMRWDAATGRVLRKNMAASPPKPEPRLTTTGDGGGASTGLKKGKVEEDEFLSLMAREYKFTPEQVKSIEEVY